MIDRRKALMALAGMVSANVLPSADPLVMIDYLQNARSLRDLRDTTCDEISRTVTYMITVDGKVYYITATHVQLNEDVIKLRALDLLDPDKIDKIKWLSVRAEVVSEVSLP